LNFYYLHFVLIDDIKDDSPLVVDFDRILSSLVIAKLFKMQSGKNSDISFVFCVFENGDFFDKSYAELVAVSYSMSGAVHVF